MQIPCAPLTRQQPEVRTGDFAFLSHLALPQVLLMTSSNQEIQEEESVRILKCWQQKNKATHGKSMGTYLCNLVVCRAALAIVVVHNKRLVTVYCSMMWCIKKYNVFCNATCKSYHYYCCCAHYVDADSAVHGFSHMQC